MYLVLYTIVDEVEMSEFDSLNSLQEFTFLLDSLRIDYVLYKKIQLV